MIPTVGIAFTSRSAGGFQPFMDFSWYAMRPLDGEGSERSSTAADRSVELPERHESSPGRGGQRTQEGVELPCEPGHGWPLSP